MKGGALMSNSISDIFKTDEYKLLFWLSEHQSKTRDGPVIKFSQAELAAELQHSPASVNKWMQALCKAGCIQIKKGGSYLMTSKGKKTIDTMKKIETILADGQ